MHQIIYGSGRFSQLAIQTRRLTECISSFDKLDILQKKNVKNLNYLWLVKREAIGARVYINCEKKTGFTWLRE